MTNLKMVEGCCSSVSPCSHQKRDPYSICEICRLATGKDRMVIGVVLPEGYTSGADFAKDCNVEVLGHCTESLFKTLRKPSIDALVNRFLGWRLPQGVCSDTCVSDREYKFPRSGTNLLSSDEARQMIEHLLADV